MEKFCLKCGTVASDIATACTNCGAALGQPAARAYPQQTTPPPQAAAPLTPQPPVPPQSYPPQSYPPQNYPQQNYPQQGTAPPNYPPQNYPPQGYAPPPPNYPPPGYPQSAPPPAKSNSALKWIIGILVTLFVLVMLAVAAFLYVAHRVKNRIETVARENGLSTTTAPALKIPVCSLLSTAEVSAAIGVPIVAAKDSSDTCEYLAAGTIQDMTAKHTAAMMKQRGADAQTQKMVEQFAGGIFNSQKQNPGQTDSSSETTPVVVVSIDQENAQMAMKLNKGILGNAPGSQILGIGDEAFDAAGGMMMVRKGDRLFRISYTACPCDVEAIKPLAKKIASQL